MSHVFISYVNENWEAVDKICIKLKSHGIQVWLDKDEIKPGTRWKQAIRGAIRDGAFFIACFSEEYNKRDKTYMNEELTFAIEELRRRPTDRVWFIPVKLNECEIPDRDIGGGETLKDLQYVELYKDWDNSLQRIVDVIQPESSIPDANVKTPETIKPLKLFISYAHADAKAKDKLTMHLEELKPGGLLDIWSDNEILPGDRWNETITNNLAKSDILLYLVSAYSLASEYIKNEIANKSNPNIKMIPIILEHCDWQNHQLSEFQVLPDKGKPIKEWQPESQGWQNVVEGIQKIVEEFTDNNKNETLPKWLYEQGNFFVILKQYGKAIEAYEHAIKLKPDYTQAFVNCGGAYYNIGDYKLAIENYSIGIKLNPNSVYECYNNRGNAYRKKGEYERAIEDHNEAIKLEPKNSHNPGYYHYSRGIVWLILKEWEKAKEDLTTARDKQEDVNRKEFSKDYIYIADFEQEYNVTLPEDIVAMLTPP